MDNFDTTKLVFGEPDQDFGGKDMLYRISVERAVGDETTPLYINGVESKNPEEWCLAKLSVFEKEDNKKKNHSLHGAFQNKFPCQQQWLELYKSKIVDNLAKNLLDNKDKVDYPLLEEKQLEEKFSHVGNNTVSFKILEQGGNIETQFNQYDESTKKITPIKISELIGTKFRAKFILLVEGIFISSTSLSFKRRLLKCWSFQQRKRDYQDDISKYKKNIAFGS